jgi:hypothetical protein
MCCVHFCLTPDAHPHANTFRIVMECQPIDSRTAARQRQERSRIHPLRLRPNAEIHPLMRKLAIDLPSRCFVALPCINWCIYLRPTNPLGRSFCVAAESNFRFRCYRTPCFSGPRRIKQGSAYNGMWPWIRLWESWGDQTRLAPWRTILNKSSGDPYNRIKPPGCR